LWRPGVEHPIELPHRGAVLDVAVSLDGQTVATACHDGTGQLWDAADGRRRGSQLDHQGPVLQVLITPDSRRVVTASLEGPARIWDAASGKPLGMALRHSNPIRTLALSPSGRTVLTGSDDATACLWPTIEPLEEDLERIQCWLEAATGLTMDADEYLH